MQAVNTYTADGNRVCGATVVNDVTVFPLPIPLPLTTAFTLLIYSGTRFEPLQTQDSLYSDL